MKDQETRKVLQLALDAGIIQLSNGAEVWRVESTVSHICKAYHVSDVDVYTLSNAIFITGNNDKDDVYAKVKHIPLAGVHMGIIAAVNDLSRDIAEGRYTVDEAIQQLNEIKNLPAKNMYYRSVASGIGSSCFIYILGATWQESIIAGIIGMMAYLFFPIADKLKFSKLVKNILGGAFAGLCACLVTTIPAFRAFDIGKIIIGSIMPLIPGVAFVNSIRDIANTDFLSGTIRILDTIMVFIYLAIGASCILSVFHVVGGAL